MKKTLFVLLMFSSAASLVAQQAQTGVNGFRFVAPMQAAVGNDSDFLVDSGAGPKVLDDNFFMLTLPQMAFQNDSRRHQFIATWVPEFEIFKHNSDQNAMNQQAAASFSYNVSRNLLISIADSYKTSKDPARALNNVFLLLPRSRYHENDIHGAVEFQPNAVTNVAVRYDAGYSRFGQTDPAQLRILDSTSNGYSFSLTRMLSRTQRLRGTYSLFTVRPINQPTESDVVASSPVFKHPVNSGTLEYKVSLDPSTIVEVTGGLIKLDNGMNYSLGGNLSKRIGYFWLGAGYARTLAFQSGLTSSLSQGVGTNGFYDVIHLLFRGQPTRKTGVLFETTMSRDVSSPLIEGSKALIARGRFDYRLSDRSVLFSSLESFQQSRNLYVQAPLSRNRFMVGIEISFSGESDRRSGRNEDGQYVALTDHARRRRTPEDN